MNVVTVLLGRVLAAWVAGFCSWLLVHYGVTVDSEQQRAFVEHLVGVVIPLLLTLYALAHRLIDRHVNPGDAASGHLAEVEKSETRRLRATR